MFEFVYTQTTKANTQSCNKFYPSMIGGWPNKFQDTVKSTKASDILNVMVKIVPFGNGWGKKLIFEKIVFCYEKDYVLSISSGVRGMS